jgi:hypothetical protein
MKTFPADLEQQRANFLVKKEQDDLFELERMKKSINVEKCRQAYIDHYVKFGVFGDPYQCRAWETRPEKIPIGTWQKFRKQNPDYTIHEEEISDEYYNYGTTVTVTLIPKEEPL